MRSSTGIVTAFLLLLASNVKSATDADEGRRGGNAKGGLLRATPKDAASGVLNHVPDADKQEGDVEAKKKEGGGAQTVAKVFTKARTTFTTSDSLKTDDESKKRSEDIASVLTQHGIDSHDEYVNEIFKSEEGGSVAKEEDGAGGTNIGKALSLRSSRLQSDQDADEKALRIDEVKKDQGVVDGIKKEGGVKAVVSNFPEAETKHKLLRNAATQNPQSLADVDLPHFVADQIIKNLQEEAITASASASSTKSGGSAKMTMTTTDGASFDQHIDALGETFKETAEQAGFTPRFQPFPLDEGLDGNACKNASYVKFDGVEQWSDAQKEQPDESLGYVCFGPGSCRDASNEIYDYVEFSSIASQAACAGSCSSIDAPHQRGFSYVYTKLCVCYYDNDMAPEGYPSTGTGNHGTGPVEQSTSDERGVCFAKVERSAGESCATDGVCESGRCKDNVCECRTDNDCSSNEECVENNSGSHMCMVPVGGSCSSHNECTSGYCFNGICECSSDDDCSLGMKCDMSISTVPFLCTTEKSLTLGLSANDIMLGPTVTATNKLLIVDGAPEAGKWSESPKGSTNAIGESLYVDINLGDLHRITQIVLWHYYDGRRYYDQLVEISNTGAFAGEQVVVYQAVLGPVETRIGNSIVLSDEVYGQYVRHRCGRSTTSSGVEFIEISVYGL